LRLAEVFAEDRWRRQSEETSRGCKPRLSTPFDYFDHTGYFIFVTLNKEELDPDHDYEDELYADHLIWVTRRGVTEEDQNYVRLRRSDTRVSLFVRNNPREKFFYAGELSHSDHKPITDPRTGKPQLRFVWSLKQRISDQLLQELTLGVTSGTRPPHSARKKNGSPRSRMPSSFDEFRKAFSYAVGAVSDRIVVPEHYNYQVRLAKFLRERGTTVEMERDFVDVAFSIGDSAFIGEIKVTRNLTLPQAFRTALGQVIEYAHLLFPEMPSLSYGETQVRSRVRFISTSKKQKLLKHAYDPLRFLHRKCAIDHGGGGEGDGRVGCPFRRVDCGARCALAE
jgi:Domain of unknown function (DUF3427)